MTPDESLNTVESLINDLRSSEGAALTLFCDKPGVAEAVKRLEAWCRIIERPPRDSLEVDADAAEDHAQDLRLVLSALRPLGTEDREGVVKLVKVAVVSGRMIPADWDLHQITEATNELAGIFADQIIALIAAAPSSKGEG